jgi:hypothetical protein
LKALGKFILLDLNEYEEWLNRFSLTASDKSVVYHHWYDLTLGIRISEEGTGTTKSCPGTSFFGGNTIESFNSNFLPLL